MEAAWGLFSCLIVCLFGRAIIHFTTGTVSEEILGNATMSLRIHFPFFAVLGILLAMRVSMQSMGQKAAPVLSSVIELAMKVIAALDRHIRTCGPVYYAGRTEEDFWDGE